MRTRRRLWCWLAAATTGSMFLTQGCGDLLRQSVRDGVFSYISGGISQSIDSGAFQSVLNDLLTGGIFGSQTNTNGN